MGKYINLPEATAREKCFNLALHGAKAIDSVPKWEDIPEGKALICVGDQGHFQYAAYYYSHTEYVAFTSQQKTHDQHWFLIDREVAEKLAD